MALNEKRPHAGPLRNMLRNKFLILDMVQIISTDLPTNNNGRIVGHRVVCRRTVSELQKPLAEGGKLCPHL
jgi:hypothetical protein